jgi:acetolactate synthase-1/2/3 large subunit
MVRMTGGQALVASLHREGVSVIFGLPGVQLYGAMAALRDEPRIRFIATRHEQATTYMADGYARASGDFGVALVVPGPGLLNASAGLSTAYSASSPVLVIAGQVPKGRIGQNVGLLHEVNDQLDAVAPVTKWRKRILEVAEIPAVIREAARQLRTGRPRPVVVDIPPETLEDEGEVTLLDPASAVRPAAPAADIERAASRLHEAREPVIFAGGGVNLSGAHDALRAVAEHLQAGVIMTAEGKGALSDAHPLSLGAALWPGAPLRALLDRADVVLAVGTRLATAGLQPAQEVIQIDVDPEEIGRNHARTVGLAGDARATLSLLAERLRAAGPPRPSRGAELGTVRAASSAADDQEPQAAIQRSLRAGTPHDAIAVFDMTQIGYHSRPFWPVYEPRTYLTSSYSGNLGYAFPTGIGARVAHPDRPVVVVCGDGGFLFNSQELSTLVRYRIPVVVVVFTDDSYGNVARDLDEAWGGSIGAELANPDFVRLAEAYGVTGLRAKEPAEVGELVREAVGLRAPVLIEVPVGRMPRPRFFTPRRTPKRLDR